MSSRIEQLIDEIEVYIDGCKFQALSSTKIVVIKEEIDDLLRELRMKTPDEIKRYQQMVSNKEAILNDARMKAESLINEATVHTNELINEHEIMQQAYAQANEIVVLATQQAQDYIDNAAMEANAMRDAAIKYTDGILENLENIISHSANTAAQHYEQLLLSMNNCNDIVKANRVELIPLDEVIEEGATNLNVM